MDYKEYAENISVENQLAIFQLRKKILSLERELLFLRKYHDSRLSLIIKKIFIKIKQLILNSLDKVYYLLKKTLFYHKLNRLIDQRCDNLLYASERQ